MVVVVMVAAVVLRWRMVLVYVGGGLGCAGGGVGSDGGSERVLKISTAPAAFRRSCRRNRPDDADVDSDKRFCIGFLAAAVVFESTEARSEVRVGARAVFGRPHHARLVCVVRGGIEESQDPIDRTVRKAYPSVLKHAESRVPPRFRSVRRLYSQRLWDWIGPLSHYTVLPAVLPSSVMPVVSGPLPPVKISGWTKFGPHLGRRSRILLGWANM